MYLYAFPHPTSMAMSDGETTVSELKVIIKEFCDERDWEQFHNSKDLAIGIVTEGSELLELFRFKDEAQVREMMSGDKRSEVEDELSDAFYFILRFAQMNGIDLSSALERKIRKNSEKYPVEKARGDNRKYDEY